MCGIAGCASLDPRRTVSADSIAGMLARLVHRGPDDEGVHAAPGILLGHRRLSVIDIAGGHQPLHGARQSTLIVANGEIYNYRELARHLRSEGHVFASASDTEVAAHAYDRWGLEFLDRLDGMFALALWDGERRRLVLARDRMGEKPLYHTIADGLLIFASELSALLAHPAVQRRIDARALSAYLTLEYVPAPMSMVAGVHKLQPGHALILEDGCVRIQEWWRLEPRVAEPIPAWAQAVERLRDMLQRAVQSRLVADVPIGVFLSGGLDSSTIAALAAREGAVETFSIGFAERSFDESAHARLVAEHIGSRHHERIVSAGEMTDLVPGIGGLLDEPIGDASIIPTTVLSRFAREHVTVALGGDGGDELFAGYPMHQAHRVARYCRSLPPAVQALASSVARKLPVSHRNFDLRFRTLSFLRGAAEPPPDNHALWMSSFTPEEKRALLAVEMRTGDDPDPALVAFREAWHNSAGAPPLARAAHLDALTYLPNDILTKVDRASMTVALEVRAPFLTREIIDFAFSLPDRYRMRGLTGKRLLRDAARDVLPASIIERPKKGFGMPVAAWLNGPLRDLMRDVLSYDSLTRHGIFEPLVVGRLMDEHESGAADHRKPLWTLLVFELWREAHLGAALKSVHQQGAA